MFWWVQIFRLCRSSEFFVRPLLRVEFWPCSIAKNTNNRIKEAELSVVGVLHTHLAYTQHTTAACCFHQTHAAAKGLEFHTVITAVGLTAEEAAALLPKKKKKEDTGR